MARSGRRSIANILLLAAFFTLSIFVALRHESWRDEAQSWLLARDLSIPDLFRQMSYEGHPCLWHLIEMPLVRLGLPYFSANLMSILFATAGAALLLYKSPLPLWMICAVLFSGGLMYYYGVSSRSYCLIPPTLFLNALTYRTRHEKPFRYCLTIALLVQTHVIVLLMAAAMSVFFLCESLARGRKGLARKGLALGLPLLSAVLFALQVINVNQSNAFNVNHMSVASMIKRYIMGYLNLFLVDIGLPGKIIGAAIALVVAGCVCAILVMLIRRHDWERIKVLAIAIIEVFGFLTIHVFLYSASIQRSLAIMFAVIWAAWIMWDVGMPTNLRRGVTCLVCVYCLYSLIGVPVINDLKYKLSDSADCAAFIEESLPEDALIFANNTPSVSAILPRLENRDTFYSLSRGAPESFATWDYAEPVYTGYRQMSDWARRLDPDCDAFYYIHVNDDSLFDGVDEYGEAVYTTEGKTLLPSETYTIYRCEPIG